jgi:cytochrome c biogenesis protein CcdA
MGNGSQELSYIIAFTAGLLSFVSPIALLLGIGAIVIFIGVILWIRANWM